MRTLRLCGTSWYRSSLTLNNNAVSQILFLNNNEWFFCIQIILIEGLYWGLGKPTVLCKSNKSMFPWILSHFEENNVLLSTNFCWYLLIQQFAPSIFLQYWMKFAKKFSKFCKLLTIFNENKEQNFIEIRSHYFNLNSTVLMLPLFKKLMNNKCPAAKTLRPPVQNLKMKCQYYWPTSTCPLFTSCTMANAHKTTSSPSFPILIVSQVWVEDRHKKKWPHKMWIRTKPFYLIQGFLVLTLNYCQRGTAHSQAQRCETWLNLITTS